MTDRYSAELTKEELQVLGLVCSLHVAQREGLPLPHGLILASTFAAADSEVFQAHLDSAVLALAAAEEGWSGGAPGTPEDRQEMRARQRARLDQQFAEFASAGRTLFPDA